MAFGRRLTHVQHGPAAVAGEDEVARQVGNRAGETVCSAPSPSEPVMPVRRDDGHDQTVHDRDRRNGEVKGPVIGQDPTQQRAETEKDADAGSREAGRSRSGRAGRFHGDQQQERARADTRQSAAPAGGRRKPDPRREAEAAGEGKPPGPRQNHRGPERQHQPGQRERFPGCGHVTRREPDRGRREGRQAHAEPGRDEVAVDRTVAVGSASVRVDERLHQLHDRRKTAHATLRPQRRCCALRETTIATRP